MSVNKLEYVDTVVSRHKYLSLKNGQALSCKKKKRGVNLTNHDVSFRSQHKVSFSAWTAASGLWHISLPLSLLAKLGPTAWKPILELPLGALLYHLILIYPPLPINLEHVILPGQRSVIFWKRLLMASFLLIDKSVPASTRGWFYFLFNSYHDINMFFLCYNMWDSYLADEGGLFVGSMQIPCQLLGEKTRHCI